jgi:CheY-like chemotaxis protein
MSGSTRILVIDDEETIRKTVSMTLKHAGYSVDTAETRKQAIEKSEANLQSGAERTPPGSRGEFNGHQRVRIPLLISERIRSYPVLSNPEASHGDGGVLESFIGERQGFVLLLQCDCVDHW